MCIETCTDSQQKFVNVFPGPRRVTELHSAHNATGNNLATRHIDVVEVEVAFGGKHNVLAVHVCSWYATA